MWRGIFFLFATPWPLTGTQLGSSAQLLGYMFPGRGKACMIHRALSTYQISLKSQKRFLDGRKDIDRRTFPCIMLFSRHGGVDLINTRCYRNSSDNPRHHLARIIQLYSPGGANVHASKPSVQCAPSCLRTQWWTFSVMNCWWWLVVRVKRLSYTLSCILPVNVLAHITNTSVRCGLFLCTSWRSVVCVSVCGSQWCAT